MDLQFFIKKQRDLADVFERYWNNGHKIDPKKFPMDLDLETWVAEYEKWLTDRLPGIVKLRAEKGAKQ